MSATRTKWPGVEAIILFGSAARGDSDAESDRDVCVIATNLSDRQLVPIVRRVAAEYQTDVASVSTYRYATARCMANSGSLFLWHLKREGRVLFERRGAFRRLMRALRPYEEYADDLLRFQEVYDDTVVAFEGSRRLDLFDLHSLFVVVRNVCMLLTAKTGVPSFGRRTTHRDAVRRYGRLPVSSALYTLLADGHLAYMRGSKTDVAGLQGVKAERGLVQVGALLRFAWRRL